MTPLITPTVHLNGTSKQELVEQRVAVMDAARALLDAMKAAMPSARDYYPQGEGVGTKAQEAWCERMAEIETLIGDVQMDAMKIALEGA